MRTWKILVMLCFSKALILVQSCTVPDKESKDHNLNIVATTTHVSDIVERLAGEHCKVISLMGPGVDPHIYKPTAKDISAI